MRSLLRTSAVVVLLFFCTPRLSHAACHAPTHLLFGEEAIAMLDSLTQAGSTDNLTKGILAHNIAFKSKDESMTQIAIAYFKDAQATDSAQYILEAYRWSSTLIAIRDQATTSKVFQKLTSVLPFGGSSPEEKARKAFQKLSEAVEQEPRSIQLRFVRATAAVESAEHLPELLEYAVTDLDSLEGWIDRSDQVQCYFFFLTSAKLYYKRGLIALEDDSPDINPGAYLIRMQNLLADARWFACSEYLKFELSIWEKRFEIAYARVG